MASTRSSLRKPARLLVIEDDAAIRDAFCELLSFEGYEVDAAHDGLEALAHLRERGCPDLILLDMMMPQLDGRAVLRALRAEPRWAGLKVIVVSATEGDAPAGVAGFVKKPFEPSELLGLIHRNLPQAERR